MNMKLLRSRRFLFAVAGVAAAMMLITFAFVPRARLRLTGAAQRKGLLSPVARKTVSRESAGHDGHEHDEGGHTSHDHAGHDEARSVELSEQAECNIGLKTMMVHLGAFDRSISVPGMVVARPGRSTLRVTAPLTGIVTKIYPIQGEAVVPGQPLFELRLTQEAFRLGNSTSYGSFKHSERSSRQASATSAHKKTAGHQLRHLLASCKLNSFHDGCATDNSPF